MPNKALSMQHVQILDFVTEGLWLWKPGAGLNAIGCGLDTTTPRHHRLPGIPGLAGGLEHPASPHHAHQFEKLNHRNIIPRLITAPKAHGDHGDGAGKCHSTVQK